ncbi:transposase [Streptomyces sp. NPDC088553]|uniref:transposase n=1 Tax=Streptomyces sp. NPDC088553 TaxID=3365864 RepID=UPI00380DB6FB
MGRGDLSDGQWAVLEPLLPVAMRGRPAVGWRRLIDGIRWRVRTGAPWRDLPSEYGPVADRLWALPPLAAGWHVASAADPAAGPGGWGRADHVGGQHRLHDLPGSPARRRRRRDGQAQKEPLGGTRTEPDDHGLGRSRGGFTAKIHLACEQGQRPLPLLVTAGQRGDSPRFTAVLEGIRVPRTGPGRPRVRPLRVGATRHPTRIGVRLLLP